MFSSQCSFFKNCYKSGGGEREREGKGLIELLIQGCKGLRINYSKVLVQERLQGTFNGKKGTIKAAQMKSDNLYIIPGL